MATTKKTTKAKTKTTKKPVAKKTSSAAKTARATTAKAATSKKAPAKKTVAQKTAPAKATKKTTKKPTDRKVTLRRLNFLSVALGVLGAVAAALLMKQTSYQFFTTFLTTNPLTGSLAPAVHVVYDIELRWIVVGILLVSAVVPLLAATRNRKKYEAALESKVMLWRWIDTAVVGGLIAATVALLSGVQDIMTLVLIGGLVAVTAALGWFAEKQNANSTRVYRGSYTLGLVTGLLPWLLIAVYALGTPIWGLTNNIWTVYALYIALVATQTGFSFSQRNYLDRKVDYDITEQRYLLYSLLAKASFVLLLILGFQK